MFELRVVVPFAIITPRVKFTMEVIVLEDHGAWAVHIEGI